MDLAGQQHAGQLVANFGLHQATQRTSAIGRVVAGVGQPLASRIGDVQRDATVGQALGHALDLDIHDAAKLLARERVEHDNIVQTVQELRLEVHVDRIHHGLFLGVGVHVLVHEELRAQVGGHDQDRVLEVHGPALTIGQAAIIEYLQQHVEDLRIGLFDLIEQHHGVRATAHGFGQLTALLVTHVARSRADQARDRSLLHVFGHVDADHGLLVVEQEVGERLGQLGLTHTGGTKEQERSGRTVRVGDTGTRTTHRVGHGDDGFLLADHALAEVVLHVQQLLVFALHQAANGNAGPVGDDFSHRVGVHAVRNHRLISRILGTRISRFGVRALRSGELLLNGRNLSVQNLRGLSQISLTGELIRLHTQVIELGTQVTDLVMAGLFRIPTRLEAAELLTGVREFGLQLAQTLLGRGILGLLELHFLHLKTGHLALQLIDFLRRGVELHTQVGSRLINQIDGLVRQLTTRNVAVRQGCGGNQRVIADCYLMVSLVTLLQATQNGDGVFHGRLAHEHLLETTLQCRILLDVLAVLVQCGRADQSQLAAGQHGLEHIAGIHGAFGRTRADDGMDLVDEGDDLAVRVLDFVEHALQALLELTTVLRAGHHGAQVKGDELLALQGGGHVARHDTLGQALHDGGLADARLTDQHRVVLGTAAQDLNHTANLLVTADDRVELAFLGGGRQVGGVLLQSLVRAFRVRAGDFRAAAHAGHSLTQGSGGDAVFL